MLMAPVARRSTVLIASETVIILAVVVLAGSVQLEQPLWPPITSTAVLAKVMLLALMCQLGLYARDLYEGAIAADRQEQFIRLLQGLGVAAMILALLYSWFPTLVVGPGVFAIAMVAIVIFGWRATLAWLRDQLGPQERLLLVGSNTAAAAFARELLDRPDLGAEIVGFVDVESSHAGATDLQPAALGAIEDIPAIVRARSVDRVVVSLADARGKLPMDKLLEMRLGGVRFAHFASVYEEYTGRISVENLRPSWLIFSTGFHNSRPLTIAKRLADIGAAAIGLIMSLPLQLLIAIAVKTTSRGPALYSQRRVGKDGRVFTMWKYRSMYQDAEAATGAVWARAGDTRVTLVGRVLRRMRLDELPQLWNVLAGDMSLVGPRPERPEFVAGLTRTIPFYGQRHVVKPGLTGWAQVRYTYGASVEDAMKKLQYDLFYVKHMSVALDLYIVLRTIKIVLLGRNAC